MSKIPKKAWKDAATLIIAGKNRAGSAHSKHLNDKSPSYLSENNPSESYDKNGPKKNGTGPRPDAAGENGKNKRTDFDILLLKRSSESRFMPNAYVFPGGVIEQIDCSDEWKDVFISAGFSEDTFESYKNVPGVRPPLFDHYMDSTLGPDVAFRICALRETFEESGVLIVKSKDGSTIPGLGPAEILHWRKRVHNNSSLFLEMCRKFNFVPDIWSLTEWSNWLTPVSMARRYDTIFYLCTLDYQPHIEQDNKETVHAQWSEPVNMLQDHLDQKLWVAPPQAYELTRLSRYRTLNELVAFAKEREAQGTERWLPFRYLCNDCLLSTLPGDDFHPSDPETEGRGQKNISKDGKATSFEVRIQKSLEEFNKNLQNVNRMEIFQSNFYRMRGNCTRLGHPPLNYEVDGNVAKMVESSKL